MTASAVNLSRIFVKRLREIAKTFRTRQRDKGFAARVMAVLGYPHGRVTFGQPGKIADELAAGVAHTLLKRGTLLTRGSLYHFQQRTDVAGLFIVAIRGDPIRDALAGVGTAHCNRVDAGESAADHG